MFRDILKILISMLLIFAFIFKCLDFYSTVSEFAEFSRLGIFGSYFIIILLLMVEIAIPFFLIIYPKSNIPLIGALILFTSFLFYNLLRIVLKGDSGCGCFGTAINSSISEMIALDMFVIVLILYTFNYKVNIYEKK